MEKYDIKTVLGLHAMIAMGSFAGVFTKLAAQNEFLSPGFCFFYAMMVLVLFLYALGWQQVIKKIPLSTAYSAKSVSVIWGLVFGVLLFGEKIVPNKLIGVLLIVPGTLLYFKADKESKKTSDF